MAKTKREMLTEIMEAVKDNVEMVEFLAHQIELLDRKATSPRKPTKVQTENEAFKAEILAGLAEADKPMTIKEILATVPAVADLSNQRVTHMLTALRADGKVKRTYVKRVAYFELGSEDVDA